MAPAKIILLLLRLGLGGVFLYAGALKIVDAPGFARDIHHYQLTPWVVSAHVAVYLPWLEVLAGLAIIIRRLPLGAALAVVLMSTVFLGAITSAWARGLDISCGCFGKEERNIQTHFSEIILEDGALLAAAVIVFIAEIRAAHERNTSSQKAA